MRRGALEGRGDAVRQPKMGIQAVLCGLVLTGWCAKGGESATSDYWVKLVCESSDRIATVHFGPNGLKVEKLTETRILQSDISGPHGIAFSPDRKNFYVSIGHGRPNGTAVKYTTEDDRVVGQVGLGLFPATADVSPDGNFLYVVNFNLHGDMVPSSVSVVDTNEMLELARIPTCVMPHGSRVTPDGKRQVGMRANSSISFVSTTDTLLGTISPCRLKFTTYRKFPSGETSAVAGNSPKPTCPTTRSSSVVYLTAVP